MSDVQVKDDLYDEVVRKLEEINRQVKGKECFNIKTGKRYRVVQVHVAMRRRQVLHRIGNSAQAIGFTVELERGDGETFRVSMGSFQASYRVATRMKPWTQG